VLSHIGASLMINIAYSSSEYYFKPSFVSIYSLLRNTDSEVHIYFLSSGVSEKNKNLLQAMIDKFDAKLSITEVEHDLEIFSSKLGLPLMRGNYSTYARILLADILIEVDDILLIDSDTLIVDDIQSIYSYIDTKKILYAVRDYVISNRYSRHEDFDLTEKSYFNMGVLYINLKAWRSADLTNVLKNRFNLNCKLKIADQSIINRYLGEFIGELPVMYNFYTYFHYDMDYLKYKQLNNKTRFCTIDEFRQAKSHPVIIHFIGTWYERPWFKYNLSNKTALYLKYWNEVFTSEDLFNTPKLPVLNRVYDFLSISINNFFGFNWYFWFRYSLIQKLKGLLQKVVG
jgi:lipopolysaccharide biosynthesis glycosyltransferase